MLLHLLRSVFTVSCGCSLSAVGGTGKALLSVKRCCPTILLKICVPEDNSEDGKGSQGGGFSA